MPDVAEPPPQTAEPPASLKALFQIPSDLVEKSDPSETPDPTPEPEKPPVKPVVEPEKPAAVTAEPDKKNDLTSRIAPDFAALEVKPEVPDVPDPDLAELDAEIESAKTAKKKADLQKLRGKLEALKQENATLKTRPAQPADDPDTKTLLEMTQKERDELAKRLERYDLQASPAFQEKYMKPRQQKFDDAFRLVKEAGADANMLPRAMSLAGPQRIEALEEIAQSIPSQMMRGRFERLVEGIDEDTRVINEKLANAKKAAQEEAKREAILRHENNQQMAKEFETLLAVAHKDCAENLMPELFTKVSDPNLAWWNELIERDDKVAKEILLDATPQKVAYAAKFASKLGTVLEMWRNERKARLATERENRELKGADPKLTQDRRPPKTEGESATTDDILSRLHAGAYKK